MPTTNVNENVCARSIVTEPGLYFNPVKPRSDSFGVSKTYENVFTSDFDLSIPHPFVESIVWAYDNHKAVTFSPDHFWVLILQSVGQHVNLNYEKLRENFVLGQDKKKDEIIVNTSDDFVDDYDWLVERFLEKIQMKTKPEVTEKLMARFSTTTCISATCQGVAIMDICQKYFEYKFSTRCGFPQVTLEGTKADWEKLFIKTVALLSGDNYAHSPKYLLEPRFSNKWRAALLPVLQKFIDCFNPLLIKESNEFWERMVKMINITKSGGGTYLNGWIHCFFPIVDDKPNPHCKRYIFDEEPDPNERGMDVNTFKTSVGISKVPVLWVRYGETINTIFTSGFIGMNFNVKTQTVSPQLGWQILPQGEEESREGQEKIREEIVLQEEARRNTRRVQIEQEEQERKEARHRLIRNSGSRPKSQYDFWANFNKDMCKY